jgi:hypothetical protein
MEVRVWRIKDGVVRKTWRPMSRREKDGPSFPNDFYVLMQIALMGAVDEVCEAAFALARMQVGDVAVLDTEQGEMAYVAAPFGFEFLPI